MKTRALLRSLVVVAGIGGLVAVGLASKSFSQCLTQSSLGVIDDNSVNCGFQGVHEDTSIWRSFNLTAAGIDDPICLERVDFGIEEASSPCGSQSVTVRLYLDSDMNPAPVAGLLLLAERTVQIPNSRSTLFSVDFATPLAVDALTEPAIVVVEIFTPRGPLGSNTRFLIGSNTDAEMEPSYLSAPDCSLPEPVPVSSLIAPTDAVSVVMQLCYSTGLCPCEAPTAVSCSSILGSSDVDVTWTNSGVYDSIEVWVNGVQFVSLPGTATTATLSSPAPFGEAIEVEVRGILAGSRCPGSSTCSTALIPPVQSSSYSYSALPNALVSLNSPIADVIPVADAINVGRVQLSLDITHPVQSDLVVRLSSPSGTQVTLQENTFFLGGFFQPDLRLTYTDDGVDNCLVPSSCECPVTPFGPGMMADFDCENAQGDWTLTVNDLFVTNDGLLNFWSLGIDPTLGTCCEPPSNLTGVSDCSAGMVTLTWSNHDSYAGLDVLRDGVTITTLTGTETSFVDDNPLNSIHTYELRATCGPSTPATPVSVSVNHATFSGESDVILALEGLQSGGNVGLIDSANALAAALMARGRSVVVAPVPPSDFGCLNQAQVLWIMTGTFPNDYRIVASEGDLLAQLSTGGVPIYFESTDHWAFNHTPSNFDERDGVNHLAMTDGDDSFTSMNGLASAAVDLSHFTSIAYVQDQMSSDDTDQFVLATDGPEASGAHPIWANDPDGLPFPLPGEAPYLTGVFQDNPSGGDVIVTTWEFGGFGGDQVDLAGIYLAALVSGSHFIRGDCNDDGQANIADVVQALEILFPSGPSASVNCDEACDGNDDGQINLADAISILSSLFAVPPVPLPFPQSCGPDITPSTLECLSSTCP